MNAPRILIVEDEKIIAEDIQDSLLSFGYDVVGSASSGEQALGLAERARPDLALMDINLDGVYDGTAVARMFRESYGIPVVYLTAYADEETLKKVAPTVPLGFILKPYNDRELRSAIEIALYRNTLEKQQSEKKDWQLSAIHSMEEGVIAVDEKNNIKFMNCAAERITGWMFLEAHEKPIGEIIRLQRSDASKALAELFDFDRQSCVRLSNMKLVKADDSSAVSIDVTASPIRDSHGDYRGFTLTFRDASTRWGIPENELQAQRQELMHEKMQALHELIEGLAHGINNSLSGSIGFLELLRRNGQIEEEFEKWAHLAISGCHDASALINKVRGFCSTLPQNPMPLDLNDLVSNIIKKASKILAPETSVELKVSSVPVWILGDQSAVEQAIMNVFNNAVFALPEGGTIAVRISREGLQEYEDGTGGEVTSNYCVVSIRDTGVGIDPEMIGRIFDPFYTTVQDGKIYGKGLGLTLAYGTMASHGGWINVESVKGEGSTFRLFFPEIS